MLNLPMVCKPLDWINTRKKGSRTLSDLSGRYFSNLTREMYHHYHLLSSSNINHFYIDISPDCGNLQRLCDCARYKDFIFELASAYAGYQLYLPAFLDFRGRIYRCGILHFHERDLARSLIQIDDDGRKYRFVNPT
ncbi:putative DNA-directed RNA polymerase [Bienertia sinuspersici]